MKREVEASTELRSPFERARDVLVADPGSVVADCVTSEERRERRVQTALAVDIGGGGLHHSVTVEFGPLRATEDSVTLAVCWHAVGHDRLLPSFEGELEVRQDGTGSVLTLRGTYTVPLGPLGRFGDGIAGRRLARQSLRAFVERAARRLDSHVDRTLDAAPWHPDTYPVSLREVGAENFFG